MEVLSVILVVLVLCSIVSVPCGLFNMKVFQALNGTKCTGMNFIKAFIPFQNVTFARKLSYGSALVYNIILIVILLLLIFRVAAVVMVATFPILIVYSSITTIAAILAYYILYIVNAVDFCRVFNCGLVTILACIVVAPVGYYMLSTQVLGYFRSVEDEVSGRFGS